MLNLFNLVVNRIDRLTSGLVLIGKTREKAAELSRLISDRNVKKTYLARVKGKFPDGITEVNEPIKNISFRICINMVASDGKPCKTRFKFLSFNGITSLVECEPLTGRTHQIRVHLQYLGYPIANDPIYATTCWGDDGAKGGVEMNTKEVVDSLSAHVHPTQKPVDEYDGCVDCRDIREDPIPEQLTLWLHSLRYEADGWLYETPPPEWAQSDWDGDSDIAGRFWRYGGRWDNKAPGELING